MRQDTEITKQGNAAINTFRLDFYNYGSLYIEAYKRLQV